MNTQAEIEENRNEFCSMPLISVIIPTYNRAHCLCEAIDSALAQSYENIEIIVIDDGSTDPTKESLKKYGNQINYLWQENAGVSAARNAGIGAAKGEWIAFLDSDDEWLPEKLEKQIIYACQHPEIVTHATNTTLIHKSEQLSVFALRGKPDFAQEGCIIMRPLISVLSMQFFTSSMVIKKDVLTKAGLFDVSMALYEDLDCIARVALLGPLGVTNEQLTVVMRKGDDAESLSSQHVQDPGKTSRSMLRVYNKFWKQKHILNKKELHYVKYGASSCTFELALLARQGGDSSKFFHLIFKSILLNPTPKVIVKAVFGIFFGLNSYKKIKSKIRKKDSGFRRSVT